MLLDTVCASLCVCVCVFCMLGFMQCSEAHSNTSKSTTWDHQIKKIYSVVLAYAVNSGDWSRNNKPRTDSGAVDSVEEALHCFLILDLNRVCAVHGRKYS